MIESSLAAAHSLVLNEAVYKTLAADKKRPLFLYEWLCYLDKNLPRASKQEIKLAQATIIKQLFGLFNAFPGPPIRQLIAKNMATLFSQGEIISLHETIERCNDLLKSKEHETQMQQLAKLCALNVIGALYERLGRMAASSSYEDTVNVLLKYMKSADSQVRIEIVQTFEKILYGLGSVGQAIHKNIYKQLKGLVVDRVLSVRCASIKCLCEMIKHSTFLYSSVSAATPQSLAANPAQLLSAAVSHELEQNVQLGLKALDSSNYDVRCCVATYLAQLIYYSLIQLQQQQQQLLIQQQMANASVTPVATSGAGSSGSGGGGGVGLDASVQQQKQQALQQQQNAQALATMNEKIRNTLGLLANGFNKLYASSSSFNLMRGAASSLAASAGGNLAGGGTSLEESTSTVVGDAGVNDNDSASSHQVAASMRTANALNSIGSGAAAAGGSGGSASQINREARIGVTYAYVELANLLGTQWLEKNLTLFLTHVLNLVNGTKSVATHLDAVYSRKCVQFILRSVIGGMMNEKVQVQAAKELLNVIDKCMVGIDSSSSDVVPGSLAANAAAAAHAGLQHVLICALFELSCILRSLNTSASILISDNDATSVRMIERILLTLLHPTSAVKCISAWCLRTLACALPALMTPLLDNCLDRLSLIRNSPDALLGYGYACAALVGAVHACPLGIPHLKAKLAFNIGEELLRTASQSSHIALQKTSIGWLLLGSFMTMGSNLVRKHLPRMIKLWKNTMPASKEEIETEKKRGDAFTWQVTLEARSGALASIQSFLVNCSDVIASDDSGGLSGGVDETAEGHDGLDILRRILLPIEGAVLLLSHLPNIIKINNNSMALKAHAATFRLKLYQTLIAVQNPQLYESHFSLILRELVAEFTLADQANSSYVTSKLRSVCHANDSILFANCWLQDADFKAIEDQLQPHSASGCEALEHDVTFLYQRASQSVSIFNLAGAGSGGPGGASTKSAGSSVLGGLSSSSSSSAGGGSDCLAALPLGVAVIDAAIHLYGLMYPRVPNKHRLQMILHFNDLIQKQTAGAGANAKAAAASAVSSSKQALQINIFTAVLGSLKSLGEAKAELGDEAIRKATLTLIMETLCHANPVLRCAAGEALGRMTQVVGEAYFVVEVAQFCSEKLRNSRDLAPRTGFTLGLGCLHRYAGSMGSGQHMTSGVSVLFALAQNPSSPVVQVWAMHALYLIIESGSAMFRTYVEPCVEFIVQSVLSIPFTSRDVYVALGKLLGSLVTYMGPELQSTGFSDMRLACLTTCEVMKVHADPMIRAEAFNCLKELHLFAPKHVNLSTLVPHLINSLVSKDFLLRKVAVACIRQLCQKDSIQVCEIARAYVAETKPIGLLALIGEKGLESLLFKILDIETNPHLIRDIHDILISLLCTSLSERTLRHWLYLCNDIAISVEGGGGGGAGAGGGASSTSLASKAGKSAAEKAKAAKKAAKAGGNDDEGDADEADYGEAEGEDDDDMQTFTSSEQADDPRMLGIGGVLGSSSSSLDIMQSQNLKLKQITKVIAPKWPSRVFAVDLIRRIIAMCATAPLNGSNYDSFALAKEPAKLAAAAAASQASSIGALKQAAHLDLLLAKKLRAQSLVAADSSKSTPNAGPNEESYLILFLQDLMRIACIAATSSSDPLKLAGLDLLQDLILYFAKVEEPNPEFKGHLVLEQYQAQVSAALRPQFSIETSAHVTAKACQVCSMWISSGVAHDLSDLKRVHQLLVSSLQKLTNTNSDKPTTSSAATSAPSAKPGSPPPLVSMATTSSNEKLIFSELSLTVEKLAVLRAWAEVYIVAQQKVSTQRTDHKTGGSRRPESNLLSLVQPELGLLSYYWSLALKDFALLSLPAEYSSQLPLEGGAFYHADLVESSKPIYKEHVTKILLAYCIWINEIRFEISETPICYDIINQRPATTEGGGEKQQQQQQVDEKKEKLFFMLLGLSLETLSSTTGLAQLSDETIENILDSIHLLLSTTFASQVLLKKSLHLCVEVLSILYKVKLSRDLMSINLLVMLIVGRINELRKSREPAETPAEARERASREKHAASLLYVILEICVRDLIKYLPNLLQPTGASNPALATQSSNRGGGGSVGSFLYLHVSPCKTLTVKDVELLKHVVGVLSQLPFQADLALEKRVSLVSIAYHILFNLLESAERLLAGQTPAVRVQLERELHEFVFDSFRIMCSTSAPGSAWYEAFMAVGDESTSSSERELAMLISVQQSALMSTLGLRGGVSNCTIMKLLGTFFQYASMKLFEPLNVYEKCKVFMCSMRCSDSTRELLCMINCLNEILSNEATRKELRVVLLKEHLSYLLKLTSSTYTPVGSVDSTTTVTPTPPSPSLSTAAAAAFSIYTDDGLQLIKSLLDLLESMVNLMSDESKEETLTVFVHILSFYLNLNVDGAAVEGGPELRRRLVELNDLVLKKLIRLGKNHTLAFKQILGKWPTLKLKIETAIKASAGVPVTTPASAAVSAAAPGSSSSTAATLALSTPSIGAAASAAATGSASTTPAAKAPKIQLKNFGAFK